jgi:lysophospholipase L1-like esterase
MRIAFLGDSLTEGWPGAAFFPLLEQRFAAHRLLNLGRAGDSVADLLRRAPRQDPGAVDLAFVWIGVNDAVAGVWDAAGDSAAWSWESRLAGISADYERVLAWTAERAPRMVCVRPLVLEAEGSVWEAHADELGDAFASCAGAWPAARTLDLRPAFAEAAAAGRGPFTVDGVHFTEAGAEVVAVSLAGEIVAAGG